MRISQIDTYVLRAQMDEPFGYSQGWADTRSAMLVKVSTDEGHTGWGEALGPRTPETASVIIQTVLRPLLLGANPLDVDVLWHRMYAALRDSGQKGAPIAAISAIDIALWDIMGKEFGVPVYQLLGGAVRKTFPAYATGLYYLQRDDLQSALVEEAVGYVDDGFKAMKFKAGLDLSADFRTLEAIRSAIGDDIGLFVDANHALDATTAISFGRKLETLGIGWFEEPVLPEDYDGYKRVADALDLPVAGGEAEYTMYGFRELIRRHAVDIVQPDVCAAGGFTETRKIAAMAHAWGIRCVPHVWGTVVALAAGAHFLAALPDTVDSMNPAPPMLEFDRSQNPIRDQLWPLPFDFAHGEVTVRDNPGLGLVVDESLLDRYLEPRFSLIGETEAGRRPWWTGQEHELV